MADERILSLLRLPFRHSGPTIILTLIASAVKPSVWHSETLTQGTFNRCPIHPPEERLDHSQASNSAVSVSRARAS